MGSGGGGGGSGRAPVALEELEVPPPPPPSSNAVRWVACRNCGRLVSGTAIGSSAGSSRTGLSSTKDNVTMVMSASPVSSTSVRSLVNSASQKSDGVVAAADGRPTPTPTISACTSYPTFPSHGGPVLGDDGKSVYCGMDCYWSDALDPSAVRLRVAQGLQKPQLAAAPTAAKDLCAADAAAHQRPVKAPSPEGAARPICATHKVVPKAETDAFTGLHAMYEHHAYFAGTFWRQVGLAPLQRYGHRGTIIAPTADRAARYRSSRPPLTSNPRCRVAAI
eukprot:ctg_730.g295